MEQSIGYRRLFSGDAGPEKPAGDQAQGIFVMHQFSRQRGRPFSFLIQRNQQRAGGLTGLRGIERLFQFGGDVAAIGIQWFIEDRFETDNGGFAF
jgi:hypothetical protein